MQFTISLAQMRVVLGNPEANFKQADEWTAEAARRGSNLVVFPEMWTSGLDWPNLKTWFNRQSDVNRTVADLAQKHAIWLNGSMLTLDDDGRSGNTSILFDPQGKRVGVYRKIHLFGLMHEDQYLTAGQHLTSVEVPWGHVGLAICYDLRFPEMFREYALRGVNIVLLPSAWPHPRLSHWRTLLQARAIENQMYMIAVNQTGSDGTYDFCGHSAIIDPWGNVVIEAGETEVLLTATIDTDAVAAVRRKIPVFQDRRPELYQLDK